MNKILTRFGEVEYDPDNTISFPEGLVGFGGLREFIVMPNEKKGPLFWIQSVEDPHVAFVLTDPTNFFLDYRVVPDQGECQKLGIDAPGQSHALAVVTVHPDRQVTLNLQAPVLFAPATRRALQVILDNSPYQTRTPLPKAG